MQGSPLGSMPRLIAIASHGERRHELALLWELCAALADSGNTLLAPGKAATVSAYQVLKHLLLRAGLRDAVATLDQPALGGASAGAALQTQALQLPFCAPLPAWPGYNEARPRTLGGH